MSKNILKQLNVMWLTKLCFLSITFLSLCSCASQPGEESYSIPLEHFGSEQKSDPIDQPSFTLSPGDKIDIMYHFNTVQTDIYRIAPHDRLSIKFLSVPVYDNIYQVRPDGYLSLPLLGDLKAHGLTVEELQKNLTNAYVNILKRPSFFVALEEYQVHLKEMRQSLDDPNMGQARLITVRDDYKITLPFVGEVSVAQKSIKELTLEANSRYHEIVPQMSVDILLRQSSPREIYVFGEVNKPGGYKINGPTSIFAALALAGGPSHEANLDMLLTLTREEDVMLVRNYNFNDVLKGKSMATTLSFDDIVYVPRNNLATVAQTMEYLSSILLFRGMDVGFSYRLNE